MLRWLGQLTLACSALSATRGQELRGVLTRSTTNLPVPGVLVTASELRASDASAQSITNSEGRFFLRVSAGRFVVRALRLGLRPEILDTIDVASGETVELNAALSDSPVLLPVLPTRADGRCGVGDGGARVATLYADARTALMASRVNPQGVGSRTRFRVWNEEWSPSEEHLLLSKHQEFVSDSLRPFRSISADSLARVGYVVRNVDKRITYRAPDADVLLSEVFLRDYCLFLATRRVDHPHWVGIGFRPAQNRRFVQVRGTLWLDSLTSELRLLEFSYAGLDGVTEIGKPGGWMEFTRLQSGSWFANRWELRMPRVGEAIAFGRRGFQHFVIRDFTGLGIVRGEVLEIAVDARVVYAAGASEKLDEDGRVIHDTSAVTGSASGCLSLPDTGPLVGRTYGEGDAALAGATVRVEWSDSSIPADSRPIKWQVETRSDSLGLYRFCAVPNDRVLEMQVFAANHSPAGLAVRLSPRRSVSRLDLALSADTSPVPAERSTSESARP